MTQAEMREVIQNERRIEMAFEEQRIGIFADGELLKRYLRILWKVWRLG